MFISNTNIVQVGDKAILTGGDVSSLSGTFTRGHEFTVESIGERGPNLVDADGNQCYEIGLSLGNFRFFRPD